MFIWTVGDAIGLGMLALFALIALVCLALIAIDRVAVRIRNTFRNFRSRRNG